MIALKSRFLLLAAFCTFVAVQGSAIPLDERALPKGHGNATTGHSPARNSTYHHGSNNTTSPHATNNTASHHATNNATSHHPMNDTSSDHGRKYRGYSAAAADQRHGDRKHHGRQIEEEVEESAYASYQVSPRHHKHRQIEAEAEESAYASYQVSPRHHDHRHHRRPRDQDIQQRDADHHRDDDWHHHHHHSRSQYSVYTQSQPPMPAPLIQIGSPVQIGSASTSADTGSIQLNSQPILRRADDAQSIFHTKRGDVGGIPGTVDIVMASPNPERVASLVMTPQNATSSDNSTATESNSGNGEMDDPTSDDLFVLDASNTTSTQFYMKPISTENSTDPTPDVPANNALVSLQVPVFVPTNVSVSQFCATYDPNPTDPVTIGMRECSDDLMAPATNSSSHASQAFLYDTDTGVLSPIWFSSNGSANGNNTDTLSRRDGLDQFTVGESGDDITPTDSSDSTTASTSSADPASTDSASDTSTDSPMASPTSSSSSTDAAATTATDATDASSATASSTTSGSTPAETSPAASDGGVTPQDVTLVFTPSGPAVPMGEDIGFSATAFQPADSGNMTSSSTDQPTDDATGQSQTPTATEAAATPTDTSLEATTTDDSVGSSTMMPTASSEMSDAPTSTEDSEATPTATDSDSMATSTSMSVDDSFMSSSAMDTPEASSTGTALSAASTASGTVTAADTLETGGSQVASSTASAPTGSMIVDSDSIEKMFNAHF